MGHKCYISRVPACLSVRECSGKLYLCAAIILSIIHISSTQEIRKWPTDFKRCSLSDPKLDDCILQAAKEVMPKLVKGSKDLGLVSLDPMSMGNFSLGAAKGPITLRVDLSGAQLAGHSSFNLQSVKYDRETFKMEMRGLHKEIELTGGYATKGKLFRVPINSKGTLLFTLKNMEATHTVKFKPRKEKDLTFMDLDITFRINHVDMFKMDLYNPHSTRIAGAALNKLLNDNWKAILAAFTPSMEGVVQQRFTEAFSPLFQHLPYEEILPPY
ncbi:circadian clock-controlled protein daywake [Halyomorpha halys]|uniref:circadian clock-controlled protein daywake n=1 Tax=Halyomorpha halys TaxID=286706 RepID=UPI0006D4E81C|nr:circadian clock-controlled protein-like [Halyomorpha halys]